jgi:hypothetical protein
MMLTVDKSDGTGRANNLAGCWKNPLAAGHSAALHMIEPLADRPRRITLDADKAHDTEDFVNELRSR